MESERKNPKGPLASRRVARRRWRGAGPVRMERQSAPIRTPIRRDLQEDFARNSAE